MLCAEDQDRTGDPTIFSRVLYQLSYLGSDAYSTLWRVDCQEIGFFTLIQRIHPELEDMGFLCILRAAHLGSWEELAAGCPAEELLE